MNISKKNISKKISFFIGLVLLTASSTGVLLAATPIDDLTTSSNDHGPEIVEILPEDFKPAFTRDTVIKLNAIVKRSYAVIEGFDSFRRELNETGKHSEGEVTTSLSDLQIVAINALEKHSHSALGDMHQAVETLKLSNEHYNVAVLAGMVMFVETVDQELQLFIESGRASKLEG